MMATAALGLAVGIPLGYALQSGGFCMNTAFRSILFEKDRSLLRAYVLVLLINIVAVNILDELALINITRAPFFWPALLVGGFVFGLGMVLAGGCTSGTWYRASKGMIGSLMALIGFAAGATASQAGILNPIQAKLRLPVLDVYGVEPTLYNIIPISHWAVKWVVVAVVVVLGGIWLLRSPKQKFTVGWNWQKTGLIIGVIAAAGWLVSGFTRRDYGLSFTQPTVSLVRFLLDADSTGINWGTFLVIGVPVGAALGARLSGELTLRLPKPKRVLQQLAGGLMMGVGAAVAGGCNIGHGLTGVSTLALSSIAATLFTIFGVWTATFLVYRRTASSAARANLQTKSAQDT